MVKAVVITDTPKPNSPFKLGFEVKEDAEILALQPGQSAVKIQGAAFNHRDIWMLMKQLRQEVHPGTVLGADGVGILQQKGNASLDEGQRVLINPGLNWDSNPRGPEGDFRILGLLPAPGTLADTINIDSKQVFRCPEHLSTVEAAALPLAGLTAYRALFRKCEVKKGDYVLVTGIGGGVALTALQFAVAVGAHVYVTSSKTEKIEFAKKLGAEGGINYKDPDAIEDLKRQLNSHRIDAVVDGSAGILFDKLPQVMERGGIIAQYGNTGSPQGVMYTIDFWYENIEIKGVKMGSSREFGEMLDFVAKYKVKPVVSNAFKGLTQENVERSISLLANGQQMGKVVIEIEA
ncbi:hypothetical protein BJV82DRAFT_566010 [Fennellomyces sp. T-0311]|nr:hypothetical protein BJV82DRAFT_566010 [Fennellomyces sp. T-0311]